MAELGSNVESLLDNTFSNEQSSELAHRYSVVPGHGRFELFFCHQKLQSAQGARFRRILSRIADEVGIEPAFLAVNAITEHSVAIYLSVGEVESQDVGLDFWDSFERSVLASGIPGVARIRSRPLPRTRFRNERGRIMPVHAFRDGPTALLAFAALLKLHDNRVSAAGRGTLNTVTRFALVRYAYNASPQRARELAGRAADGTDVLIPNGPAGPAYPLRTATIRAVQSIAVSEDFFQ